jgi:outer membrane protein assembly factor BamB
MPQGDKQVRIGRRNLPLSSYLVLLSSFLLACLWLAFRAPIVSGAEDLGQIGLPGEASRTARRLEAADKLAADKKWTDALEEYQHILDEAGDDLVPLGQGGARQCVQARWLCHLAIAALPADGLRLYRARVDEPARKWLEQGTATHDTRLLRRVLDEAFCSRSGALALDLLGDLAFERGRFDDAEYWWRMLAGPNAVQAAGSGPKVSRPPAFVPAPSPFLLAFPDPPKDLEVGARAKQLLARLFRGERRAVATDLKAFRARYGQARGHLAGRDGSYADILLALAEQPDLLADPPDGESWTTFAANPSRNAALPRAPSPSLWRDGSQWCFDLEKHAAIAVPENGPFPLARSARGKVLPPAQAARSLAFHPVIVGDWALVADIRYLTAYNLKTGAAEVWYELEGLGKETKLPAEPDTRFTLTIADGRVYARMGTPTMTGRRADGERQEAGSWLVSLPLKMGPDKGRRPWQVRPTTDAVETGVFEGAPVACDGRVYIAATRVAKARAVTNVSCYDASRGDKPLWQQDVCDLPEPRDGESRYHRHLLTLAGPQLVYCSHAGAIIALDALSGRRSWAVRYSGRSERTDDEPPPRDLAPGVYAEGRLYVAPADSDRLLCLDPTTGRTLWERDRIEVVHLVGVADGRLIFTATAARPGLRGVIRAVAADTGADIRDWLQPEDGDLPAFGRGFVAGDQVFWPTRDGLRILDANDGQIRADRDPSELRRVAVGNMVYGNGYLVVTDAGRLFAYASSGRRLGERREELGAVLGQPSEAAARFSLALAEADAGLYAEAQIDLVRVERDAIADALWRGQPLRDLARQRRHEVLLRMAEYAAPEKRWDDAADALHRAMAAEFPVPSRLRAFSLAGALWETAGQPVRAVQVWQTILGDEALRSGTIVNPDGSPHRAAAWATARIDELIRGHGVALYAPFEKRARELLDSAPADERCVEVLQRLTQEYPNAAITGPALVRLAALHEKAGRIGSAAQAYRLLLCSGESVNQPSALAGLARAYERQHCWDAARATWQRLDHDHGERTLAALDPEHTVRQFVARQLQKADYRMVSGRARPDLAPPLLRQWHASLADPGECLLVPEPNPTSGTAPCLFFARGTILVCRDAATGRTCWECTLRDPASWVGRHADLVLAAGADNIHALRLADGRLLWQLEVSGSYYPAPAPDASAEAPEWKLATLSGFHLAGSRLFFLQGERRLFALDVESGRILWHRWAPAAVVRPFYPAGRFQRHYFAGAESLMLQTSGGKCLILDSETGHVLHETETSRDPWPWPPRALDGQRVCLVSDSRRAALLHLPSGKEIWSRTLDRPTSLTGEPPQMLGREDILLLLVPRNLGSELQRLDPGTGQTRWETLISTEAVDLESTDFDDSAVYFVSRNHLQARSLADGKRLWKVPVEGPAGRWRTARARSAVLAYPLESRPDKPFPVVVCEPKSGEVIQRLNFPASTAFAFSPEGDQPCGTAVQIFDRGMAVVRAGNAWGLVGSPVAERSR